MQYSKNVLKRLYYDYYFHRQENLWRQNALKTLPVLLNSSDMLACGEDLGLIPSCVHPVCPLCIFPPSLRKRILAYPKYIERTVFKFVNVGYARTGISWVAHSTHA